jgi:hypothetical protein
VTLKSTALPGFRPSRSRMGLGMVTCPLRVIVVLMSRPRSNTLYKRVLPWVEHRKRCIGIFQAGCFLTSNPMRMSCVLTFSRYRNGIRKSTLTAWRTVGLARSYKKPIIRP